jgi:SOS-response transcriptional repressor LexA
MRKKRLTKKQEEVYNTFIDLTQKKGYFPTSREIGEALDKDEAGIHRFMNTLEEKGWIKREDRKTRTARPVGFKEQTQDILENLKYETNYE